MNWGTVLAKLIMAVVSLLTSSSYRTRFYELKNQNEILKTALDDITRMDRGGTAGNYARRVLDDLDKNQF